jgi:hypothetical protein
MQIWIVNRQKNSKNAERLTRRFGVMAAVARRKFCANLEVCLPQEVQWKPPLRQAAGALCVSRERIERKIVRIHKAINKIKKQKS